MVQNRVLKYHKLIIHIIHIKHLDNKNTNFHKLKIIVIKPTEVISDFNKRFLGLYNGLGAGKRIQISVYDYCD